MRKIATRSHEHQFPIERFDKEEVGNLKEKVDIINKEFQKMGLSHWEFIPVKNIINLLNKHGLETASMEEIISLFKKHGIDIENDRIITNKNGAADFDLSFGGKSISHALRLAWHKDKNGKWKIIGHIRS